MIEQVNDFNTMLIEPKSGLVKSLADWYSDYLRMKPEIWGGTEFTDAELVEVVANENGEWVEVEL